MIVNLVRLVLEKEVEFFNFMYILIFECFFNFIYIMEVKREKMVKEFLSKGGFSK